MSTSLQRSSSRAISLVLAVGEGGAGVIAALVVIVDLVRDRPVPHLAILLAPAVPLLFAGQLWTIAYARSRGLGSRGIRRGLLKTRFPSDPRRFFFGDLNGRAATAFLTVEFGGWLAAMTAFPALARGGPAGASEACPYRLDSHGTYSCVTKTVYEHVGAAEQRFAAAIMLCFFCLHTAAASAASPPHALRAQGKR